MKEFKVLLNSIVDVKKFVNTVSKYDFDIDLVSDRYVVDAKSIMGIFSLDLSKEIKLNIYSDNCENLISELKEYEVK
ncbi:MAG: HPr family phosphocarrier protein [Clostridia bacterium]|nr:HPr family phosphocarrier protein [Clostridia bacterium]